MAPFVAGAAADVIEAYANTHNGAHPSPALVQQILDGTATDIDAPAGEQVAGSSMIHAAVNAADQQPGSTLNGDTPAPGLVSTPTQLGRVGRRWTEGVHAAERVQRVGLGDEGHRPAAQARCADAASPDRDRERVGTAAGTAIPAHGAQAAAPVTFNVPTGTNRLNADMIWPDPTNSNILYYILTDPKGG